MSVGDSDIIREGTTRPVTASEPTLYLGAVMDIAESIQQRVLRSYEGLSGSPDGVDFEDAKSDVNLEIEKWVEFEIFSSRWPEDDPLGVLKASDNPNAFQFAGVNFEQNWDSVIHDMAFEAMRADVYETMKGNGWDENSGFPYEVD